MKNSITLITILVLLMTACSKSKTVDSPILGEYECEFTHPQKILFGDLTFNSDGTVDGRKPDSEVFEKKIFTYEVENDSILTLTRSFEGDKTESIFVITSKSSDIINLRLKAKIRIVGGDASAVWKPSSNEVTVVEYDSKKDSILYLQFLKRNRLIC